MADITEISGLIAAGLLASPFEDFDIVISGTQGSLRGPCGALIFFRNAVAVKRVDGKGPEEIWNVGSAIEASVFPRHQGGPHNHTIMAAAVAMKHVQTETFKNYQRLVLANTTMLADRLLSFGCDVRGHGTQNHQLAVKIEGIGLDSAKEILDEIEVACNVITATSELHFGSYAMTSRGLFPDDFRRVVDIIYRALAIAKELGGIKDVEVIAEGSNSALIGRKTFLKESKSLELRQEMKEWMSTFNVPWE